MAGRRGLFFGGSTGKVPSSMYVDDLICQLLPGQSTVELRGFLLIDAFGRFDGRCRSSSCFT